MTVYCEIHRVYGHATEWHLFGYRRLYLQLMRRLHGRNAPL